MYRDLLKIATIGLDYGFGLFSMPCFFVLISRHFKPFTEIRANQQQLEAEAAKKIKNNLIMARVRRTKTSHKLRHNLN